jgi:hypothetical protein
MSIYASQPSSYITTGLNTQSTINSQPSTISSQPDDLSPIAKNNLPFMNIFGPLGQEYCMWFYFLSIIGFVLLVILLVSGFIMGIMGKKPLSYYYFVLVGALGYFIFYFQNRLLFTMCHKSI